MELELLYHSNHDPDVICPNPFHCAFADLNTFHDFLKEVFPQGAHSLEQVKNWLEIFQYDYQQILETCRVHCPNANCTVYYDITLR